jgi:hypothetical protein
VNGGLQADRRVGGRLVGWSTRSTHHDDVSAKSDAAGDDLETGNR